MSATADANKSRHAAPSSS